MPPLVPSVSMVLPPAVDCDSATITRGVDHGLRVVPAVASTIVVSDISALGVIDVMTKRFSQAQRAKLIARKHCHNDVPSATGHVMHCGKISSHS